MSNNAKDRAASINSALESLASVGTRVSLIEMALSTERKLERAKIVAWLRDNENREVQSEKILGHVADAIEQLP